MLTIPEAVKALFKTDGTWKNFRVHFPNGEFSDITNSQVVRESVRFTESVCSQQVLRFGMTEASMIEFETVGVGNMYGMLIECGIEIDTTSLSAAQISAIQADPGDGVLVTAADSDVGRGFYRIPYGTFRVTSCPRNQGAMTHRRVQACSVIGGQNFPNNPVETAKLESRVNFSPVSNYTPSIPMIVYAALGWYAPELMAGMSKTLDCAWADMDYQGPSHYMSETWTAGNVKVTIRMPYKTPVYSDADNLFQLTMGDWDGDAVDDALDWIETTVNGLGADGAAAKAALTGRIGVRVGRFRFDTGLPVFYPKFVSLALSGLLSSADVLPMIPVSVSIDVQNSGTIEGQYSFSPYTSDYPTLYKFTTSFDNVRGNFAPTSDGGGFVGCYDCNALVTGWLEIYGQYVRPSRAGGCDILTLDDSAPAEIGPADMPEFWWDEYDVSPVGVVRYAFGEGAERQVFDLQIGDGGSVYDLQDNYFLATIANATQAGIEALLQAGIVPQLAKITYTPVELTMRSWPWIQAGDALELTAEDGTVVDTYAMTRTIEGIQLLMDAIESKGGELMEG